MFKRIIAGMSRPPGSNLSFNLCRASNEITPRRLFQQPEKIIECDKIGTQHGSSFGCVAVEFFEDSRGHPKVCDNLMVSPVTNNIYFPA